MSDSQESERQPGIPADGIALGGASTGAFDRTLRAGEEMGAGEAAPVGEGAESGPPSALSAPGDEGQLGLPRGGLVAFRKSGGLRFTSRGIVVSRSGWVIPLEGSEGRPRHMNDAALAALATLLLRSGLGRQGRQKVRGTPDGYVYEITARYGGRTRYAEAVDGAIPAELRRLIDVLQRLLPRE